MTQKETTEAKLEQLPFAVLLRRLRLAAGFTQEELAERAQITDRAIRDLERAGGRTPRLQTVQLLAQALGVDDETRASLLSAARPAAGRSPALRTSVRLPLVLTPLVGRAADVAVVSMALQERRLVTISGTGGVGKTRLAIAVADRARARFDRIHFVDLAPIRDPRHVLGALATTLSLREEGSASLFDLVVQTLRSEQALLVLDNMEHLLEARETVLALLDACRNLSILITSREPLRVRGERVYTLGPLPLPERESDAPRSPAVQLFLDRARDTGADVALDGETTAAMAEVCRRLDGLPLAIELAAAWSPILPPPALLRRLAARLPYLEDGPYDLPARQRTMRDTIAWSYDLLTVDEQSVFRRLSLFNGGWSVEAAMAVCAEPGREDELSSVLRELQAKNLISGGIDASPGDQRLSMLETIREYALALVAAHDELEDLYRRYTDYYVAFAGAASIRLVGPERIIWQERLEREHDNLRVALRWAIDSCDLVSARRLAEALWRFWANGGYLTEGRQWLRQVLALVSHGEQAPSAVLAGAAVLALEQGDLVDAALHGQRALEAAREQKREREVVLALNVLGTIAWWRHGYEEGRTFHEEALRTARRIGDRDGELMALSNMVFTASLTGERAGAADLATEAVATARALGDPHALARALVDQAVQLRQVGSYDEADTLARQALELFRAVGEADKAAEALLTLGLDALGRQEYRRAVPLLEECLTELAASGRGHVAAAHGILAIALLNLGDLDGAEVHVEASYRTARERGVPMEEAMAIAVKGHLALARNDVALARQYLVDGATRLHALDNRQQLPGCLEGMIGVAAAEERWDAAAHLCGMREQLLEQLGSSIAPLCPDAYDSAIAAARSALGETSFQAAVTEGRTLSLERAIAAPSGE